MPVVPRQTGPQVATQALPGARVSTNAPRAAFGVPAVVDLSGVERQVAQIVDEERLKADQVAVLDADNQLAKLHTDLELQATERKGKDALGALSDIQTAWEKGTGEIGSTLTSDRQRQAFAQRKSGRWAQLYEGVERHANAESLQYDNDTTAGALNARLNDAIRDPSLAGQSVTEARALMQDYARRNGMAPELLKDKTADVVSRIHVGVLNRYLATDQDRAASAYYAEHKDEVVGAAKATIEHALDVGTTLGESQRLSLAIVQKHERLTDALADVDTISDPKVQEATRRAVKERFSERDVQAREDYEQVTDAAFTYVSQGRRPPAPIMAQLKGRELIAVNSYLASRAKKEEPQTDWGAYYKLRLLATSDDPKERAAFKNANLFGFRHVLGDTEFKEMVGMQTGSRQGKADPLLDGYRTTDQIVSGATKGLGLDPKKDSKRIEVFQRAVDIEVSSWKRANKDAQIPSDEVQKIVDGLLIKSPDGSRFEHLSTAPEDVRNIDDVPLDEQRLIRQTLIRRNIFPSMDQIVELYRQRLAAIQAGLE